MNAVPQPLDITIARTSLSRDATREPLSCMTGNANTISDALIAAKLSGNARHLLEVVKRETFGNAGWHRKRGRPEHTCDFSLVGWAQRLGWNKSYLIREREKLVALGVLIYTPDEIEAGVGTLAWNLTLAEWLPLRDEYRRARYTRVGAGWPKGRPRKVQDQEQQQPDVDTLILDAHDETSRRPLDIPTISNGLHNPPSTNIKRSTPARSDASIQAPSVGPSGIKRENKPEGRNARARAGAISDLDRILETLRDAPGYRVDEKLEWRVLEALCPIGVGLSGDGCDTFEIAFVLEQATTFVAWRGRLDEIERESASAEKRKPSKPRCDAQTFKRFMQSDKAREDYRTWRNTRAIRAHQDRAETSTREHTAALASASSDYLAAKRQHDADLLADARARRRARFTPSPRPQSPSTPSTPSTPSAKGARSS